MVFSLSGLTRNAVLAAALVLSPHPTQAFIYKVIHNFRGGADGSGAGGLVVGPDGNLYGAAAYGGGAACNGKGCGFIFKMTPKGRNTVVYRFLGSNDGAYPSGPFILDSAGNIYGVTEGGGASCSCGTVFHIAPDGTESVLHVFAGGTSDGSSPNGGLIEDASGNLYGTTSAGGPYACPYETGCGTVFKLATNGTLTLLHAFSGQNGDGAFPNPGLISDPNGDLYGTTFSGGGGTCGPAGCGTVYEITTAGSEIVLHAFAEPDGLLPVGGVARDSNGNLYGTTTAGYGTIYKLASDGTFTTILLFDPNSDGKFPVSTPLMDTDGNLYLNNEQGGIEGWGTVFELKANGTGVAIHQFPSWPWDGNTPGRDLVARNGVLYGTAEGGLYGKGVVFALVE